MQNPLTPLLEKEMDRREFLVHIGAGILAFLGISTILKVLGATQETRNSGPAKTTNGYGGGPYGQ
jgi:hypothetical protein